MTPRPLPSARTGGPGPALAFALVLLAALPLRAQTPAPEIAPAPDAATPAAALADPGAAPRADALTLEQCYREALRSDPAIRLAASGFEAATGAKLLLQSRALPRLGVGVEAGQQGPREESAGRHSRLFFLVTGTFDQALFDASIPAAFRRGRIGLAIAEQDFNRAVAGELYALRIDFYNALNARANVEVQESTVQLLQANLDSQENQYKVGKVPHRAVRQAEVQLAALQPGLAAARGAYLQARIDLARRLGRDLSAASAHDADQGLPVPAGTLESDPPHIDLAAEGAYALAHRPDLLSLRQLIAATAAEKTMAEAGYWPKIDLVGNLQYIPAKNIKKSGTIVQPGNENEESEILIGGSLSWQVIDTGTVRGQAVNLQAIGEGYKIDLQRMEDDVPRQLRQVQHAVALAASKLEGTEQNVALAGENFRLVAAQVANGDLPQLDFLNAQSNLLQARFNRLNALLENNIAAAQLDVVTGRYLEFVGAPPAAR
jgi:outer membrane protein TolC